MEFGTALCDSNGGRGWLPSRPAHEFAAAIGAGVLQQFRALCAKRAFKRANKRTIGRRDCNAAFFASGFHFERHAAPCSSSAFQVN
jgi:hypothetical protein